MTDGKTIGDAIIVVADKLQIPVEHIYTVIVQAQPLIAILNIVSLIIMMVVYFISLYFSYRILKHEVSDKPLCILMCSVLSLLPSGIVCLVCCVISDSIIAIYMPEYAAVKMIGDMIDHMV